MEDHGNRGTALVVSDPLAKWRPPLARVYLLVAPLFLIAMVGAILLRLMSNAPLDVFTLMVSVVVGFLFVRLLVLAYICVFMGPVDSQNAAHDFHCRDVAGSALPVRVFPCASPVQIMKIIKLHIAYRLLVAIACFDGAVRIRRSLFRCTSDAIQLDVPALPGFGKYVDLLTHPAYLALALDNNGIVPSLSSP